MPSTFATDLAHSSPKLLSIFHESDVNTKLNQFNDVLQTTLDLHAPMKTIKIRNRPCPFVTPDIKELMKTRDQLHRRFLQSRDAADWTHYTDSRNTVKRLLRDAEKNHTSDEVKQHKHNPGSLWKIINRVIPSKEQERHIYTRDSKTVADEFNQYFASVGINAAVTAASLAQENNITLTECFPESPLSHTNELFSFRMVSCADVHRVISSLPLNKSPGPDKVASRVYKDCLPVILGPLTDIINCSLRTSTFPTAWKEAEVIPILKEGDHEVASNNRPLSLLAVASKVCEKIVLEQFNAYLVSNNRLSSHQSGNKKLHSTETLNIHITDTILDAMDKKKLTALILLDLSKAFDSINHRRLLHKLSNVGVAPATLNWFKSYLSDRTQSVRIGSTLSNPLPITHGVPQGAILSPLLFCIYLNDLPYTPLDCCLESYVDDSKVFLSFTLPDTNTALGKIERDLLRVASWCCQNHLLINPTKTKFLVIGTRQLMARQTSNISITFLGKTLTAEASAKDLGIHLDSLLTYDVHISKLVSSCISKLCQINRVKDSFDTKTLLLLISSLVFSKMFYSSTVWSNTSAKNIKKLQLVQNFACKVATNSRKFDHVTPLLRQLNWLPVAKLLLVRDAIMTYKCINNLAPSYLCKKLSKRSDIHNRRTRNRDSLQIPLQKTAAGQRSFSYRAVNIWNSLDCKLKNLNSVTSFKKSIREHFLALEYNS